MIKASVVQKFLENKLNVIGVNANKTPSTGAWRRYITEMNTPRDMAGDGIGLICGAISGNLEVIDIDLKYDISGDLYERYTNLINDQDPTILSSLVIIKTPSDGYHWLYRADSVEGNKKLAVRETTEEEKKLNPKERYKVLLETRGEGGYIATIPLKGYEVLQGKLSEIPKLTNEQREILHACAREFNEKYDEVRPPSGYKASRDLTPWEDFNSQNTCLSLLEKHGWAKVSEYNERIMVRRAGETKAAYSGNIHTGMNLFICYSTSTEFDPEKAYSPFAIYATLEHNEDFSAAASELYKQGFGARNEETITHTEYRSVMQQPTNEEVDEEDENNHIADYDEMEEYLQQVYNGKEMTGKTTGSDILDKNFLFKEGAFVVVVGHTNIGKTTVILHLQLQAAIVHGWKSIILPMEDKAGKIKRRLMEFYAMKPLRAMSIAEYNESKKFVDEHFTILKGRGGYIKTIPQALNICYKLADKGDYKMLLIDPYSAFKKELRKNQSTHDYDYDIAGDILDFSERTGIITMLNSHTSTPSRRRKDEDGTLSAPYMDDVEGGGKWPNRADQVIVLHRKTTSSQPAERAKTLFYLEKDRELEAGGELTSRDNPVPFGMMSSRCELIIGSEASVIQRYKAEKIEKSKGVQTVLEIKDDLPF